MIFNDHSRREGQHAFLSPSSPAWLRYDDDKLDRMYLTRKAAREGTAQHAFAALAIKMRQYLADEPKTLNMYVNDSIAHKLSAEQMLFGSDQCFGTSDAVGFGENTLRIFDLKTGVEEATPDQLVIYAALFCIEYDYRPFKIELDLRIYQNDEAKMLNVAPEDIFRVMEEIQYKSDRIKTLEGGVL